MTISRTEQSFGEGETCRPRDIAHGVEDEDHSSLEALLRIAGHVHHPHTNDETRDRSEKANDRVTCNRRCCMVIPIALPYRCTAGDYGQTIGDQHEQADVGDFEAKVSAE